MRECQWCMFWEADGSGVNGICRCKSPRPRTTDEEFGWWPMTNCEEWCGEFKSDASTGDELFPWAECGAVRYRLARSIIGSPDITKRRMVEGVGWMHKITFGDVIESGRAWFESRNNVGKRSLEKVDAIFTAHGLSDAWLES